MQEPLISVILPTYNRADILHKSIKAVLEQSYHNLELIIIDDGSTDETANLITTITDSRIRYLQINENKGVANARNEGVISSRGELIAFADSDDIWIPEKLALQIHFLNKYPHLEIIFGDYLNINHLIKSQNYGFQQNSPGMNLLGTRQLDEDSWEIIASAPEALLKSDFIATPTVIMRANVFIKTGYFNNTLLGGSDFEYWWRAAVIGVRFAYQTIPLIIRHKIDNSITAQKTEFTPRLLQALQSCANISQNFNHPELIRPLRKAQHRAWTALIWENGKRGEINMALIAFKNSLSFGNSFQAWIYAFLSLFGVAGIRFIKELYSHFNKLRKC